MAKKRILKKDIYAIFEDMLFDVWMHQYFADDADDAKIKSILLQISRQCEEFICRTHHIPDHKNKKAVKQYFQKLIEDLNHEIKRISQEIEALNQFPDKQEI
jgi:uncharacterized membrane-anchored protein YjiN (DUF445 family)